MNRGIPTMYRGLRTRSRIEARWAAMFDGLGWGWEYEPLDLNGYIPDFVLTLHRPVLVEVKHELSLGALKSYAAKIDASGWQDEALIVGAAPRFETDWFPALGWMRGDWGDRSDEGRTWDEASWSGCKVCKQLTFIHWIAGNFCRRCGAWDGGGHQALFADVAKVDRHWRAACNQTAWKAAA